MQYDVTIRQVIVTTAEVYASDPEEARRIGDWMLANDAIPFEQYRMIEGSVSAEEKDNVISFPVKKLKV